LIEFSCRIEVPGDAELLEIVFDRRPGSSVFLLRMASYASFVQNKAPMGGEIVSFDVGGYARLKLKPGIYFLCASHVYAGKYRIGGAWQKFRLEAVEPQ
jgi:hypothetical protein